MCFYIEDDAIAGTEWVCRRGLYNDILLFFPTGILYHKHNILGLVEGSYYCDKSNIIHIAYYDNRSVKEYTAKINNNTMDVYFNETLYGIFDKI